MRLRIKITWTSSCCCVGSCELAGCAYNERTLSPSSMVAKNFFMMIGFGLILKHMEVFQGFWRGRYGWVLFFVFRLFGGGMSE